MERLIDKDYFKDMLLAWEKELSENPNAESDIQIDMIRQFCNSVEDFPTIEAEPIRHGQWVVNNHYGVIECSSCGYGRVWGGGNYCSYCGAKMDGDSK